MPVDDAPKLRRLSRLRAHEVSLVKSPANRKKWLIYKSEDKVPVTQSPAMVSGLTLTPEQTARIDAYLQKRARPVSKSDGDDAEGVAALDERAQASLKAVFRILQPMKDQITRDDIDELLDELGMTEDGDDLDEDDDDVAADEGVDPADGAEEALDKSAQTTQPGGPEMATDKDEACSKAAGGKMKWDGDVPPGMAKDKHEAAMKAAQAAYKAHVTKDMDDDEDDGDTDKSDKGVAKSADGGMSLVEKRQQEAVIAKCATLEQQVREMKDERVLKSIGDDLRTRLRHLPINVEKTARVLKHLAESDKQAHDDYLSTLTAANEVTKSGKAFGSAGMFGAMGSSGVDASGTSPAGGSAEARMEAYVDGLVSKADKPLTRPAAWAAAINTAEGAKLYNEMIAEERGH